MNRMLLCLMLTFAALARPTAAETWPALVTPTALEERLATPGLRIVDLRGSAAYAAGHAEGAVSMPVVRWKAASPDRLSEIIGAAGIHPDRPLLLVHYDNAAGNFAEAAWIAWELKSRGIRSVSILDGGMKVWQEADIPQTQRVHDRRANRLDYPQRHAALADVPGPEEHGKGMAVARTRVPAGGRTRPPARRSFIAPRTAWSGRRAN